jgi:hypothetical protein
MESILSILILIFLVSSCRSTAITEPSFKGFRSLLNGNDFDAGYLKIKNNDNELAKRVFTIKDGVVHVFDDSFPKEIDLSSIWRHSSFG